MPQSARNKEKDSEGRMPLAEHLRELRNRLAKAVLAILVVTIAAAFYVLGALFTLLIPEPAGRSLDELGEVGEKSSRRRSSRRVPA